MKTSILRKLLLIFSFLAIAVAFFIGIQRFLKTSNDFHMSIKENSTTILCEESGNKLFIRARAWGLAGNHEEIVVSERKEDGLTHDNQKLVIYASKIYYKITQDCKLVIYAPNPSFTTQKITISNIEISIIGLKNYDEIMEFDKNYKQFGLKRFGIFDVELSDDVL
jgi:hypothetical protein